MYTIDTLDIVMSSYRHYYIFVSIVCVLFIMSLLYIIYVYMKKDKHRHIRYSNDIINNTYTIDTLDIVMTS
jgi:hypothetical protein